MVYNWLCLVIKQYPLLENQNRHKVSIITWCGERLGRTKDFSQFAELYVCEIQ
jgi:hypothetical protein